MVNDPTEEMAWNSRKRDAGMPADVPMTSFSSNSFFEPLMWIRSYDVHKRAASVRHLHLTNQVRYRVPESLTSGKNSSATPSYRMIVSAMASTSKGVHASLGSLVSSTNSCHTQTK